MVMGQIDEHLNTSKHNAGSHLFAQLHGCSAFAHISQK